MLCLDIINFYNDDEDDVKEIFVTDGANNILTKCTYIIPNKVYIVYIVYYTNLPILEMPSNCCDSDEEISSYEESDEEAYDINNINDIIM